MDELLYTKIKSRAKDERRSINKTVKKILAGTLGHPDDLAGERRKVFMDVFGKWSRQELADFEKHLNAERQIDEKDWK